MEVESLVVDQEVHHMVPSTFELGGVREEVVEGAWQRQVPYEMALSLVVVEAVEIS
jgi:hypothetical protein